MLYTHSTFSYLDLNILVWAVNDFFPNYNPR